MQLKLVNREMIHYNKSSNFQFLFCFFFPFFRSKSRSVDHGISSSFDLETLRAKVDGQVDKNIDGGKCILYFFKSHPVHSPLIYHCVLFATSGRPFVVSVCFVAVVTEVTTLTLWWRGHVRVAVKWGWGEVFSNNLRANVQKRNFFARKRFVTTDMGL